ncbi:hypothetical protein ABZ649_25765 [Streptomyces albidoflavus]|uniref:hypothetical protein n=1 Tax=Streptomyces albidoflavus TaxID=1886 RepID=UPI0010200844|nr:hypothetical protein [Streptomyces albidoflavus]MCX4438681.1 hypothetical protein [Streptomyces albidoflavus]RZE67088.1 hypothetical protein C0Q98_00495 [Streptomyces albidoflavus]WTB79315.1 hypothetical protein OG998_30280 [Streptomyces albidoflavus]WTD40041.1 hypothetical protein OH730_00365 [Streptomyces albidoflavus]WTD85694.1 hypothetical protein OHA92_30205 [Streptomyces albidoflavus]
MRGLLLVVLALAVGGCVCVVWAARGGPRWVRVVSRLTLGAAELVRHLDKNPNRNRSVSGDD